MFILKFIDGGHLKINQDEYQQILTGGDTILLPRLGQTFKKSSFSRILSESDWLEEEKEKKKNQKYGVLHDGVQVMRHFGGWVKSDNAYEGNDGSIKYEEVFWDYDYYPEIAMDAVKNPQEYQEWKNLLASGQSIPYLKESEQEIKRFTDNQGFKSIGEIIKVKKFIPEL